MRHSVFFLSIVLGLAALLAGCSDEANPVGVSTHPAGFASAAVHGQMVLESPSKAANCTTCHGDDYRGGTSDVACYDCHASYPHPEGFASPQTIDSHAAFVAERIAWDITGCRSCHGDDYAGKGTAQKSCLTCHSAPEGPEACSTCHGDDASPAPPEDLAGESSTTLPSVGAHAAHVAGQASPDVCAHCHPAVTSFDDPDHLGPYPVQAEIAFGAVATDDGRLAPVWDPAAGTCSNVYCHGNFAFEKAASANPWGFEDDADAITGAGNLIASWTNVGGGQAACGTCHDLPPAGHRTPDPRVPASDCATCHPRVVDLNLNILDPALHVNGRPDLF